MKVIIKELNKDAKKVWTEINKTLTTKKDKEVFNDLLETIAEFALREGFKKGLQLGIFLGSVGTSLIYIVMSYISG